MSESWSREEIEATVADCFHMLTMELAEQQYSKTDHRRKLIRLLKNRSDGTIERRQEKSSYVPRSPPQCDCHRGSFPVKARIKGCVRFIGAVS